jgi:polar amino acid transport system permease protein
MGSSSSRELSMKHLSNLAPCIVGTLPVLVFALSMATNESFGWYVISPATEQGASNLRFLLDGYTATITVSLLAIAGAMAIGLAIALPGLSENRCARALNRGYVKIFRSIPMLVMLLWVYDGLPVLLDINLDVFAAGASG